jgi:beta-1,4-mannosyltransferase
MKCGFYWGSTGLDMDKTNPYGPLLARAMEKIGVELVSAQVEDLSKEWLNEHRGELDVLHIHWPHYTYTRPDLEESVANCSELMENLWYARHLGYKVVWTVHNLYPHESIHPELDRIARMAISEIGSALIVHCEYGRAMVERRFHRTEGVFTIPHGNFIDAYPNEITRQKAREHLGLSNENFVYLFFGNVRPYKGVEQLLETFSELSGEHLRLLLAAKLNTEYSKEIVRQAEEGDPRILVRTSEFFPSEDFQIYLNAADVVVLPFEQILTSGSVITALSFGKPVVVPRIGCLTELVSNRVGVAYEPNVSGALKQAMEGVQDLDLERCSQEALNLAKSISWERIAEKTAEAYECER